MQCRIVGPQPHGLLVMGHGLGEISEPGECDGQVVMGGGIVGDITQCLAEAGRGLGCLTQCLESGAEVEVIKGRLGIQGQCLANPCHGLIRVAALRGNHAKQVMGIGMVGVGLENLPIKMLGHLQVAGVVKLQSTVELFILHNNVVGTLRVPLDAKRHTDCADYFEA